MKSQRPQAENDLTLEKLRDYLNYDLETGVLTWRRKPNPNIVIGSRAGCIKSNGYRYVRFDNFEYVEHRLIWFGVTGQWPVNMIDHKNGVKSYNAWSNLREATVSQNGMNTKVQANNTTGHKGIDIFRGKFRARIRKEGCDFHLGLFDTLEEAIEVRASKEKELHGEFARMSPIVNKCMV